MTYNDREKEFLKKINILFKNFSNDNISFYLELLQLIYDIIFSENCFLTYNINLKYSLESSVKLLSFKNKWFLDSYSNDISFLRTFILQIFNIVNHTNGYLKNQELKKELEEILLFFKCIDLNTINQNKNFFKKVCIPPYKFDNKSIKQFFEEFNIDFTQRILKIGNTLIPNFGLCKTNIMIDFEYEFYHLLFKIYAPILLYGKSFQEGFEYTISEKDVIFDCGGNMGFFALYAASKGAQVYCFEPMSYIRSFLKESQKLYPNNIHIIPFGVGNENTNIDFYQTLNPGASQSLKADLPTSERLYKEKCKIITLDGFVEQTKIIPTFIKCDIEGSELLMTQGAKQILQIYQPILHLCLNHRMEDQFIVNSFIQSINPNYKMYFFAGGGTEGEYVLCKNNA